MKESILPGLFSFLNMAVLERVDGNLFEPLVPEPEWFRHLYPEGDPREESLDIPERSAFLQSFLQEADDFWTGEGDGRLRSGSWCEVDSHGTECHLEATAIRLNGKRLLLIECLGAAYQEKRAFLQKGREARLDYAVLARRGKKRQSAPKGVERENEDMVSVVDQIGMGVVMTDEEGRLDFMNAFAEERLGRDSGKAIGKRW